MKSLYYWDELGIFFLMSLFSNQGIIYNLLCDSLDNPHSINIPIFLIIFFVSTFIFCFPFLHATDSLIFWLTESVNPSDPPWVQSNHIHSINLNQQEGHNRAGETLAVKLCLYTSKDFFHLFLFSHSVTHLPSLCRIWTRKVTCTGLLRNTYCVLTGA